MKTDLLAQLTGTFQHLHQGALVFNLIGFLIFRLSQMDYHLLPPGRCESLQNDRCRKLISRSACASHPATCTYTHILQIQTHTVTLTEMLIYTH